MHTKLEKEPPVLENIQSLVKDKLLRQDGKDDGKISEGGRDKQKAFPT